MKFTVENFYRLKSSPRSNFFHFQFADHIQTPSKVEYYSTPSPSVVNYNNNWDNQGLNDTIRLLYSKLLTNAIIVDTWEKVVKNFY